MKVFTPMILVTLVFCSIIKFNQIEPIMSIQNYQSNMSPMRILRRRRDTMGQRIGMAPLRFFCATVAAIFTLPYLPVQMIQGKPVRKSYFVSNVKNMCNFFVNFFGQDDVFKMDRKIRLLSIENQQEILNKAPKRVLELTEERKKTLNDDISTSVGLIMTYTFNLVETKAEEIKADNTKNADQKAQAIFEYIETIDEKLRANMLKVFKENNIGEEEMVDPAFKLY